MAQYQKFIVLLAVLSLAVCTAQENSRHSGDACDKNLKLMRHTGIPKGMKHRCMLGLDVLTASRLTLKFYGDQEPP